ncbi:MAG: AAA family ATPase [Clostridium sp.]|uniref:AAA family ATPase n=1 Tax=Clostridium sp. TaxID=1506 RepID=UPI003F40FB0C
MAVYLNTRRPLENYKNLYRSKYFVDKSTIIEELNEVIDTSDKYICVTRPRRFGKSSVAEMLGAYYSKAADTSEIFDKLKISSCDSYAENINKYNVISISFNMIPDDLGYEKKYEDYIKLIKAGIVDDLKTMYPEVEMKEFYNISQMLEATNEKFIFIFDEWDYIFNNNLFKENQNDFLEFLRNMLKDKPYVSLCYMTGVLPIKRYSSGSALNMFDEFTFLRDRKFGEFFGFTETEVRELCKKNKKLKFEELEAWYNGYQTALGVKVYNPRSVVKALLNNHCESYWTNTGAMEEVGELLKCNTLEIRDDIIEMVTGEEIDIVIDEEFRAGQEAPKTKEEIYSAMIVLGFLSYYDGYLKIPNKELMREFEKALKDESFGYVAKIVEKSKSMLKATINKDTKTVEKILHDIHNSEIPILQYQRKSDSLSSLDKFKYPNLRFGFSLENSLSCVLTLAYLSARDTYRVEREEKTGKGYADFTFHPRRKNDTAFIVELKKDVNVEIALEQIKNKEYIEKFKYENEGKKVLAVAISYDSKEKEHKCLIEEI